MSKSDDEDPQNNPTSKNWYEESPFGENAPATQEDLSKKTLDSKYVKLNKIKPEHMAVTSTTTLPNSAIPEVAKESEKLLPKIRKIFSQFTPKSNSLNQNISTTITPKNELNEIKTLDIASVIKPNEISNNQVNKNQTNSTLRTSNKSAYKKLKEKLSNIIPKSVRNRWR